MEPTSVIWIYSGVEGDLILTGNVNNITKSYHVVCEDGCMSAFRAAVEMARGEGWNL